MAGPGAIADGGGPPVTRARIRGIYATALTERLRGDVEVVQASPAIDRRFDGDFAAVEHDVAVETTEDREGVGLVGDADAVAALRGTLADVSLDTLSWPDPAPAGAVIEGTVLDTPASGAIVDLGDTGREGFLPYDAADGYVRADDEVRVQVHEPRPPWADTRPVVGTAVRTVGGIASLERGRSSARIDVRDDERAAELGRSLELLDVSVPEGWGVRLGPAAADADLPAIEGALERAAERARSIDAGESPDDTAWVRFGREGRFALDGDRRRVHPTMPGHHRIKAGSARASDAVDFAERLCDLEGGFPFDAVTRQFGPVVGDTVRIVHGKPEGHRFPLGRGEVVDRDPSGTVTIRREMTPGGEYDALGVTREEGDVALTKVTEGQWWYPTVYLSAGRERKGTYVNVCTPVEVFPTAATYVDLHVDVVKHPDGTVERVDDDQLDGAVDAGHVSPALADRARSVAAAVERGLRGDG